MVNKLRVRLRMKICLRFESQVESFVRTMVAMKIFENLFSQSNYQTECYQHYGSNTTEKPQVIISRWG
jgi:hypothetical protein